MKRYQEVEALIMMMMLVLVIAIGIFVFLPKNGEKLVSYFDETLNTIATGEQIAEQPIAEKVQEEPAKTEPLATEPVKVEEPKKEPVKEVQSEPKSTEKEASDPINWGAVFTVILYIVGGLVVVAGGIFGFFFAHYKHYRKALLEQASRCKRAIDVKEQLEEQLSKLQLQDKYNGQFKNVHTKTEQVAQTINRLSQDSFPSFVQRKRVRTWSKTISEISSGIDGIYTSLQTMEEGLGEKYFSKEEVSLSPFGVTLEKHGGEVN